jgi:hypothetical protein
MGSGAGGLSQSDKIVPRLWPRAFQPWNCGAHGVCSNALRSDGLLRRRIRRAAPPCPSSPPSIGWQNACLPCQALECFPSKLLPKSLSRLRVPARTVNPPSSSASTTGAPRTHKMMTVRCSNSLEDQCAAGAMKGRCWCEERKLFGRSASSAHPRLL